MANDMSCKKVIFSQFFGPVLSPILNPVYVLQYAWDVDLTRQTNSLKQTKLSRHLTNRALNQGQESNSTDKSNPLGNYMITSETQQSRWKEG